MENAKPYPGDASTPEEMLGLAQEYQRAAECLRDTCRRGHSQSYAPYRWVAIHATELYLTALLLFHGHRMSQIRGMQHNLAERAKLAINAGLALKTKTAAHLADMTANREYLLARYEPAATKSQINRLEATLNETAEKVMKKINTAGIPTSAGSKNPVD